MPKHGTVYDFRITAANLGSTGEVKATLSSVTKWRGQCGNKPLPSDSSWEVDFDLKFHPDDYQGWTVASDGQTLTKTGITGQLTATLKVRCYDYAAFGILTVTAKRKSDNKTVSLSRRIPRDVNENKISDAWTYDSSYATFEAATADDAEKGPNGNGNPGDSLNAFEEYRGFWVSSGYRRMHPNKKDVFIVNLFTEGSQGYGYAKNLPHPFQPWLVPSGYVFFPASSTEGCGQVNFNNYSTYVSAVRRRALRGENIPGTRRVYAIRVRERAGEFGAYGVATGLGGSLSGVPSYNSFADIDTTRIARDYPIGKTKHRANVPDTTGYEDDYTEVVKSTIGHEIGHYMNLMDLYSMGIACIMTDAHLDGTDKDLTGEYTTTYSSRYSNVQYDLVAPASTTRPTLPAVRTRQSLPSPPRREAPSDDDDDDDDDDGDDDDGTDTAPAAPTTPTTVACGNRWRGSGACSSGGTASSRDAHRRTCGAGHSYWGCNSSAVEWHATTYTCTRSGCGQTYTKCSKGNGSCRARKPSGGTYQWHN